MFLRAQTIYEYTDPSTPIVHGASLYEWIMASQVIPYNLLSEKENRNRLCRLVQISFRLSDYLTIQLSPETIYDSVRQVKLG